MGSEWGGFFGNYFMMKNCDFWMKDDFFQSLTLVLTQKQKIIIGFQARNVTKSFFELRLFGEPYFKKHMKIRVSSVSFTLWALEHIFSCVLANFLYQITVHIKSFLKFYVVYKIFPDFVIWSLLTFFTW